MKTLESETLHQVSGGARKPSSKRIIVNSEEYKTLTAGICPVCGQPHGIQGDPKGNGVRSVCGACGIYFTFAYKQAETIVSGDFEKIPVEK